MISIDHKMSLLKSANLNSWYRHFLKKQI